MTGTPPKAMRFELRSDTSEVGTTIRIHFPNAVSRNIVKDNKKIDYNAWDESIGSYGPIQQRFCGENRYIGVKNILEFYITPGCILEV